MKNSYEQLGTFIRTLRQKKYQRAKEFVKNEKIGCSFSMYSFVETGTRLPSLDLLLEIGRKLSVNINELVSIWLSVQITKNEFKGLIDLPKERPFLSKEIRDETSESRNLDNTLILTPPIINYLIGDKIRFEIFQIVVSKEKSTTLDDLHTSLQVRKDKIANILEHLHKLGAIFYSSKMASRVRPYTHIPDDKSGLELRNMNFSMASADIFRSLSLNDLKEKRSFRLTFTRRFSEEQAKYLCEQLARLVDEAGDLTNSESSIYSLCLLLGKRQVKNENSR